MGAWRTISVALEADTGSYSSDMAKASQDTAKFGKSVDTTGHKVDELDAKLGRAREGLGIGVAVGTVAGLGVATKAASDLREAQAAANVVFGEGSDVVNAYADDAAQAIGLSREEALKSTATFGNLFTQLGLGGQEAANLSTKMVTLAADFGSFFNEDPTRIIEAQTAAFRGEYDALQRYVPTINAAAVEQRAMADTGKANADSLTQQEKALAVYALMMNGAGAAVGDFARSNGSAATEAKKAAAESKNAAASIGEALLPVTAKAAEAIGFMAQQFGRLPGPVQTGVVGLGGMVLATTLLLPKLAETWAVVSRGVSKLGDLGAASDGASASTGRMGKALGTAGLIGVLVGATFALNEYRKATTGLKIDTEALLGATNEQIAAELTRVSAAGLLKESDLVKVGQQNIDVLYAMRDALKANGQDALPELDSAIGKVEASTARAEARAEKYASQNHKAAQSTGVFAGALGQVAAEAGGNFLQDAIDGMTEWSEATVRGARIGRAFAEAIQSTIDVKAATDELADSRGRLADTERGLRDAYEAVADANRSVATARESVADAERSLRDAYAGVEDARRGVTDAEEAAVTARQNIVVATEELAAAERAATGDSDEYRAAMQGVYDAEADLTTAQENSLTAQELLTTARASYSDVMRGLARDAAGSIDDVLSAEIRLRDAQRRAAELGQPNARGEVQAVTADERLAAQIAIREAERTLEVAREREAEARAEYERQQAAGVEGSDAVVAASEAVSDATRAEVDAQGNLESAVMRVAGVQVDANGRVTVAQEALQAAIRDRVDADQAVIDARDAVVDAQERVGDAVRGVRDANREVEGALRGVRDANERVTEQKESVVTARGEVEGAEKDLAKAISDSILKYAELYLVTSYDSQVRTAMRGMTGEVRDLVAALGGLNGDFTANVNLGGNAAGAILNGTTAGAESIMGAVMGSPWAAPIQLVPSGGRSAGPKAGGRSTMAPVPQMAPNWAQPGSLGAGIDYQALGDAVAASMPHQGPLVNVEAVNEGVGLEAVFKQAEFASRGVS